jgi:inositol oxygenase
MSSSVINQLEEIDDFKRALIKAEYEQESDFNPISSSKKKEEFRNYVDSARQKRVENFYHEQHSKMTVEFVEQLRARHLKFNKCQMGVWEALEYLNTVVDDSDPDTNLTQLAHAMQTAEAIRRDFPGEEYDWFHLVGLIHDLGKLLAVSDTTRGLSGDPQWAVVGDTFPVGCKFEETNIFHQYFSENPDSANPKYNTELGMYTRGCGLTNVLFSWGHDEYLYQVCVRNGAKLPLEGLYMIRFHSFYPWHRKGGYEHLLDDQDRSMLEWVVKFNQYDLYSKSDEFSITDATISYYKSLIAKYFPTQLNW